MSGAFIFFQPLLGKAIPIDFFFGKALNHQAVYESEEAWRFLDP